MESEDKITAYIERDEYGNIVTDNNGNVTCVSQDGTIFQLEYGDIDFTYDAIQCNVDDKMIYVKIPSNEENSNNNDNGDNNYDDNENDANTLNTNGTEQDKRETMLWDDAKTKLFLQLYKEKNDLLTKRKITTKKMLWQMITKTMQEHGYNVTSVQVENKYKSLERSYKNMMFNHKKTGRARMSCPYETQLTELLGHKHNIQPLAISGKQGLLLREDIQIRTSVPACDNTNQMINLDIEGNVEPITSNLSTNNRSAIIPDQEILEDSSLSQKHSKQKKSVGRITRISETWQKTIENLMKRIQQDKEVNNEIQRQLVEEYKAMRNSYEESMKKIQEQLIQANKLRQERNNLLREIYLGNRDGE